MRMDNDQPNNPVLLCAKKEFKLTGAPKIVVAFHSSDLSSKSTYVCISDDVVLSLLCVLLIMSCCCRVVYSVGDVMLNAVFGVVCIVDTNVVFTLVCIGMT